MNYEERRNDPVIRAEVEKIIYARRVMLLKAAKQLKDLTDEMRELELYGDDGIYDRCFDYVWSAYYTVSRDANFKDRPATETYIGNMAAGSLGEYIEKQAARERA